MGASAPLPSATREGVALARELARLLGPGAVSTAPADLAAASRDGWPRLRLEAMAGQFRHLPDLVARPADSLQVQAVIEFAKERRIAVVPVGGGAGGNGAALAVRGGIALEMKRLCGEPQVDVAARSVEVQAGVKLARLEQVLQANAMTLGALPPHAGVATVGGFLATRSGGASSGRLGKAEDLLLALEAVDGNGTVLKLHEGPRRGVDLAQLLLGSEGTLAIFTSARLRIARRPDAQALLSLRCGSMVDGARAMQAVLRAGFRPSISRLFDPLSAFLAGMQSNERSLPAPLRSLLTGGQQELLRAALRAPRLLNGLAEALGGSARLVLQLDGYGDRAEDDAAEERAAVLRICKESCACELVDVRASTATAASAGAYAAASRLSRSSPGLGTGLGEQPDPAQLFAAGAFVEELDVAATWDKVPRVLGALRRAASPHALLLARIGAAYLEGAAIEATLIGPAGPLSQAVQRAQGKAGSYSQAKSASGLRASSASGLRASSASGLRASSASGLRASSASGLHDDFHEELALAELRAEQALSSALAVALDAGATLSHSSGIGISRQLLLPREHGEGMRQLRALKQAFDPHGILNPGKLLL